MKSRWLLAIAMLLAGCESTQSAVRFPQLPNTARTAPGEFLVVTVANKIASGGSRAGSTPRGYQSAGAYVISTTAQKTVEALARDYRLTPVAAWPIEALGVHCVVFRRPSDTTVEPILDRLRADSRVRLAQPLQTFTTSSNFADPFASMQSNLGALGVEQAQRLSRGKGVRIALVDTGVDTGHPDFGGRIKATQNFVDSDAAAFKADLHGTEMAGVIAAQPNNHIGIAGVAPDSQLLALKACWQTAGSVHAVCNSFTLAQALTVAVRWSAKIVNLSLAGPSDPLLAQLVAWGAARGVVFFGAVPESGKPVGFPSELPDVIAVGSTSPAGSAAGVLNAPGQEILTITPGGHYDFVSGSSIATASVSGVAALLLSANELNGVQLRSLLRRSSGTPQGSVNACVALQMLGHGTGCKTEPQIQAREAAH